jgi:predicted DNA-binding transcriptional regulator AlpA
MSGEQKASEGGHPAPGTLKFERMADLECRVSLKKSQLWKLIREGQFPAPIKQGRSSMFIVAEVDAWMQARIEESRVRGK